MHANRWLWALSLIFIFPLTLRAQTTVTLRQAVDAAGANVDVSIARQTVAAAQADVVAADRAPVPVLNFKTSQIDLQNGIGAGNAFTRKRVDKSMGLDWTWERGNKRQLRTESARAMVQVADADLGETVVQQKIAASNTFWDLVAAQEKVTHLAQQQHLAVSLAQTIARRVSAGDLPALDAVRADIEASRARREVESAQAESRRLSLVLAQVMKLPGNPALQTRPEWPAMADATTPAPALADLEQRSDVQAARQRVQAAEAARAAAQALRKTDVVVGGSMDHYPGVSTRLMELRVQIPLQGFLGSYDYDGEVARALAQLSQAQEALDKARRAADTEQQRMRSDLTAAAQRVRDYQDGILPRARQVTALAELAYAKGAMSLTDVLDARRTLRAVLLEEAAARADHARAFNLWALRVTNGNLALQNNSTSK